MVAAHLRYAEHHNISVAFALIPRNADTARSNKRGLHGSTCKIKITFWLNHQLYFYWCIMEQYLMFCFMFFNLLFHRCIYAVSNHDFVEAYKCQTVVVQYPLSRAEKSLHLVTTFSSTCVCVLPKIVLNILHHFWRLSKLTKKKTGESPCDLIRSIVHI